MIWENVPHNTTGDLLGLGFRMWVLCTYLCIHGLVSGSIYSCHVPGQVENAVLTYLCLRCSWDSRLFSLN